MVKDLMEIIELNATEVIKLIKRQATITETLGKIIKNNSVSADIIKNLSERVTLLEIKLKERKE